MRNGGALTWKLRAQQLAEIDVFQVEVGGQVRR